MRRPFQAPSAFTLIELLATMSIIAVLMSVLLPSLSAARKAAQATQCLANLHNLGGIMTSYLQDHNERFWPYYRGNYPQSGQSTYYCGTESPVNYQNGWLLAYTQGNDQVLQCPAMPWGSYVPQGSFDKPSSTYGYNANFLAGGYGYDPQQCKRIGQLPHPGQLFVFADAAIHWSVFGTPVLQNSMSLDPPVFYGRVNNWPTTQFRHMGKANALCADGHAQPYGLEGGTMVDPQYHLGSVGKTNAPHYEQP